MMPSMNRLARFAWTVLAYNLAVILWGAAVRATGSGAGCGNHWPLCNGEILPRSPRIETLIELSHRLTSGLALILVIVLLVATFRSRLRHHPARRSAVWSTFFLFTEAAVGAGLVLFELVADNQSMARALFMATHLVNTFFLLAALTRTCHDAARPSDLLTPSPGGGGGDGRGGQGVRVPYWAAASLLLLAGASGAVAALGDTLFPATSLRHALEQDLSSTSHLLIRLRLFHPVIAVGAGLLAAFVASRQLGGPRRRVALWTIGLVGLQIAAGLANIALLAPIWMQLVHLLLADLLWIAFVLMGVRYDGAES